MSAAVAVDGDFDDCQAILKALFAGRRPSPARSTSPAVNSINFARIAAQAVYYFTAAVALGAPERAVAFAVPTGNFGDAFAGYVAQRMGLPIERIIVATNANDIVARALETGGYRRGTGDRHPEPGHGHPGRLQFRAAAISSAPSATPSRPPRPSRPSPHRAPIDLPPARARRHARALRRRARSSEAETAAAIAATLRETGELIDPHTAVAVAARRAARPRRPATPLVVLSTAHPAKFPEAVGRRRRDARRRRRRSRGLTAGPSASTACRRTPRP